MIECKALQINNKKNIMGDIALPNIEFGLIKEHSSNQTIKQRGLPFD